VLAILLPVVAFLLVLAIVIFAFKMMSKIVERLRGA
ncbi:MAG: hypothetical protein H6Q85_1995, partial [candidate division NC10 bacterium]|nr:hypothetical protein [candidate division NC10 bacterium]